MRLNPAIHEEQAGNTIEDCWEHVRETNKALNPKWKSSSFPFPPPWKGKKARLDSTYTTGSPHWLLRKRDTEKESHSSQFSKFDLN